MTVPKRIHIASLGFEVERVFRPAVYLSAEKLILIKEKESRAAEHFKNLKKQLPEKIELEIREVSNYWAFEENMNTYAEIFWEELNQNQNSILVNLSSGSKLHASIGLLACQMFGFINGEQKAFPYYVRADEYRNEHDSQYKKLGLANVPELNDTNVQQHLIEPFIFSQESPKLEELRLLEALSSKKKKKTRELTSLIPEPEDEEPLTYRAKSARLLRALSPLIRRGMIEKSGSTRSQKYGITNKGSQYLNSFKTLLTTKKGEIEKLNQTTSL